MLKCLSTQDENGLCECAATNGGVVQFQALQASAIGIDDIDEELVQRIVSRLFRTRVVRIGWGGCSRLVESP